MKLFLALIAFLLAGGAAVAQSGLDLLDNKMNALIRPADNVVLGNLGRLGDDSNEIEWLSTITVADMPVPLPLGSYVLDRPNGVEEAITLTAENPMVDVITMYKPGPFGVFTQSGQMYRTDGFTVRAPDEMLALLQSRWPYFRENEIVPVSRPDLTSDKIALSQNNFRQSVGNHVDRIMALLDGQELMELAFESRIEIAVVSDTRLATALAGLAAVGTQDDAARLFEQAEALAAQGAISTWPALVETAVLIESRTNTLGEGHAAQLFDRYLNGEDSPIYPLVVNELAAFGHRPALSYLFEALPTGALPPLWDGWDRARAFSTLTRFESPELYDFSLRIIETFRAEQMRILEGQPWQASDLQIELSQAIDLALFYASTRPSENEAAPTFPIPHTNSYLMSLGPALEDPSELVALFLKNEDGFDLDQLAAMVCPSMHGRSADAALLDRLYNQFRDLAIRGDHIRPEWLAQTAMSIGMSNCLVTPAGLKYLETPIDDVKATAYPLPWRYGLSDLSTATAQTLENDVPYIDHHVADAAPDRWINDALVQKETAPAVAEYLQYRSAVTTAGNYETGPFSGNVMLRMFLQPLKDQPEQERQVWALGEVGVRIQSDPANDIVYFGLSVQAVGYPENALAATFAREPEMIAANVENGGIAMIDKVVFRHGPEATALAFSGTISSGIHAYTMNGLEADLSDAVLDVYFAPKNLDGQITNRWVVSFPLHASPFAFESRVSKGLVTFQ